MKLSQENSQALTVCDLPNVLPKIELRHGEMLWALSQLGFQGAASDSTFFEYIKSLRKLGTPFERGEVGIHRRGLPNYSYYHLMELALALTLRVYNAVPDSVLTQVISHRKKLYRCYRRAYSERQSGIGSFVAIKVPEGRVIELRGLFLDLQINFSGGTLVSFGPPKSLSAVEAVSVFAQRDVAARALLPINLSLLSERLVLTALRAQFIPLKRRGSAIVEA